MKKILVFGASSSKKSINKAFANFAASQLSNCAIQSVDLNDFEMPIYSVDKEADLGSPAKAQAFKKHIKEADGIIASFAEHNGSYSAAFKNILDWVSRIEGKVWENKPMLLLSTSPGGRGGMTVLNATTTSFPHMGAQVAGQFSLPSFGTNFSENSIVDADLKASFDAQVQLFEKAL